MMHQPVDPSSNTYDDRPVRESVIQKDEVISLKIDLEVLSPEEIYKKYFDANE